MSPFFMTYVGRFVKHLNFREIVIDNALYFTHTGATFDVLCSKGMTPTSKYCPFKADLVLPGGDVIPGGIIIPSEGSKFPWTAPTPWVVHQSSPKAVLR